MKVIFVCNICNKRIEKKIRSRKDNKNKTKRLYKCTNECKRIRYFISAYNKRIDLFNIFNPVYWLNFYNNDPVKTILHLKKLNCLANYFKPSSHVYFPNIFNKFNIDNIELENLIKRIKSNEINLNNLKKYNNLNSINRWLVLGFSKDISTMICEFFKTTKYGFMLRGMTEKDYENWKEKSITNRKTIPKKETNPLFVEYWLKKGFTIDEAKEKISLKNARGLDYFINKYGVNEGTLKYYSMCKKRKKSSSLEGYIKKYGEIEGKNKFIEITKSKNVSLEKQIERYGEDIGLDKHNKRIQKMINSYAKNDFCNGSKIANLFFDKLQVTLDFNIKKEIVIGNYICDCLISERKLIIEFFGDYWHKNPLYFIENNERFTKYDKDKLNFLKDNYNVIVVWESCVKRINDVISLINEKIKNNTFNFEVNFDGTFLKIDFL